MDTKLVLESMEAIENKDEALHILVQFLSELNAKVGHQQTLSLECRKEWETRLTSLEKHVMGSNGIDGFRIEMHRYEVRLELIEKAVAKWVTRISTALLLFNVLILPLLLYVFFNTLGGK